MARRWLPISVAIHAWSGSSALLAPSRHAADPQLGSSSGGAAAAQASSVGTWALLKESVGQIGDQVGEINLVRKDLTGLQEDLALQEQLWRQADTELQRDNDRLQAELEQLQREALQGQGVQVEAADLKQAIEEAQRQTAAQRHEAGRFAARAALWARYFERRSSALLAELRAGNGTETAEVRRLEAEQRAAERAGTAVELRIRDLEAQLQARQQQAEAERVTEAAKTSELTHQLSALRQELERTQASVLPREQVRRQLADMQARLQEETDQVVRVQRAAAQGAEGCAQALRQREEVLHAEQSKVLKRRQEVGQFCDTVRARAAELQQGLSACS